MIKINKINMIAIVLINMLTISLITASSAFSVDYYFTTIGSKDELYPKDINNNGTIVGAAYKNGENSNTFFTYNRGTLNTFTADTLGPLTAYGINDSGLIVGGAYNITNSNYPGFLYNNNYELFQVPGVSATRATDINNNNIIVGSTETNFSPWTGFIYNGTNFTQIRVPEPWVAPDYLADLTSLQGINDSGRAVGYFFDNGTGGFRGFIWGAILTTIDFPNANQTLITGINNTNIIVGIYRLEDALNQGFIFDGNTFTSLNYPGASETWIEGINDLGQIVGYYKLPDNSFYGFIADPSAPMVPIPGSALLLGTGLITLFTLRRIKRY